MVIISCCWCCTLDDEAVTSYLSSSLGIMATAPLDMTASVVCCSSSTVAKVVDLAALTLASYIISAEDTEVCEAELRTDDWDPDGSRVWT